MSRLERIKVEFEGCHAVGISPKHEQKTDMDDLISRLQALLKNPVVYGNTPDFPACATEKDIAKAEEELGFPLPTLLKEVYTKVANGGFGPSYGILGIPPNGGTNDLGGNAVTVGIGVENEDGDFEPVHALLPICYWGCTVYSCLDCTQENGAVYVWDAGELDSVPEAASLREWLEEWLESEESYEPLTMLDSERGDAYGMTSERL